MQQEAYSIPWFIGVVLAFIPITLTWVELRREQHAQREQTQKEIMDTYDRMIEYRLHRPEVLGSARRWEHTCFDWIYDHGGPDGDAWGWSGWDWEAEYVGLVGGDEGTVAEAG